MKLYHWLYLACIGTGIAGTILETRERAKAAMTWQEATAKSATNGSSSSQSSQPLRESSQTNSES